MRRPLKNKSLVMILSALLGLGLWAPAAAAAGTPAGAGARPAGNSGCC